MSAVRNNRRSILRNDRSSPYARPHAKKSAWSISGLLSYLNPLRTFTRESEEPEDEPEDAPIGEPEDEVEDAGGEEAGEDEEALAAEGPSTSMVSPDAPQNTAPARQNPPTITLDALPRPPQQPRRFDFSPRRSFAQRPELQGTPPQATLHRNSVPPQFDFSHIGASSSSAPGAIDGAVLPESDGPPSPNKAKVMQYLQESKGRKLNPVEIAGLVSLLKEETSDDTEPEPFRFQSRSASRATSVPLPNGTTPSTSRQGRMLSKNPNGVYKWQGAGSARPRQRYHSPGFGQPRSSSSRIKLSPPRTLTTDTKRRRVGSEAETSSAQPVTTSPTTAAPRQGSSQPTSHNQNPSPPSNGITPGINGTSAEPNMNGTSSLPRIHASSGVSHKPSTPVRPSPLRQAWSGEDPPSPPAPPARGQTRAAAFMQELVRENTAPKKPDIANPYQQMMPSPMRRIKRSTIPARKTRSAAAKEREEKEKEKQQEREKEAETQKQKQAQVKKLSAQSIIEATVPKGSKRARPPPELLEKSPSKTQSKEPAPFTSAAAPSSPRRSQRLLKSPSPPPAEAKKSAPTVEEVPDDEGPAAKKQRKESASREPPRGTTQDPEIVEIDDDDDQETSAKASGPSYTQPSEVVEPAESSRRPSPPKSNPPTTATTSNPVGLNGTRAPPLRSAFSIMSTAPKAPSRLRYSYHPESDGESSASSTNGSPLAAPTSLPMPTTYGPAAPAAPVTGSTVTPSASLSGATKAAPPVASSSSHIAGPRPQGTLLPAFSLAEEVKSPKRAAIELKVELLPVFTFTLSPPSAVTHSKAKEDALALPESALPNYDLTTQPATAPAGAPAPATGFNWAAAGVKAPAAASGAKWTCSTCMCVSPATAEKCVVCEEPRP